jgi:hypothetical protein
VSDHIPDSIPTIADLEEDIPRLPVPLEEVARGGPVFLTGQMRSGKSHVAKHLDRRETVKLSAPMWAVAEFFFGEDLSKDQPGIRSLMQEIGRLGRGDFGPDLTPTASNASFIQSVRDHGGEITDLLREQGETFMFDSGKYGRSEYPRIDWSQFGRDEDFWLNILLDRISVRRDSNTYDGSPAIPDVRYPNTVAALLERDFGHVHVTAPEETRVERGAPERDGTVDRTEKLGLDLDLLWKNPAVMGAAMGSSENDLFGGVPDLCLQRVAAGASVVWSDPDEEVPGELTRAENLIQMSKIYPAYAPVSR